jgi:HEAT repeat protein
MADVPALIDALKDQDEDVRIHAAEALQKIDPEAARKAGAS